MKMPSVSCWVGDGEGECQNIWGTPSCTFIWWGVGVGWGGVVEKTVNSALKLSYFPSNDGYPSFLKGFFQKLLNEGASQVVQQ